MRRPWRTSTGSSSLTPSVPGGIASRGEIYRLRKRYDEALADFNRAIELNPGYTSAIASRGQVYQAMQRYEEALVLATSLYDDPAAGLCGDAPAGLAEHPEHGLRGLTRPRVLA